MTMVILISLLILLAFGGVHGFVSHPFVHQRGTPLNAATVEVLPPTPVEQVKIYSDAEAVGDAVRHLLRDAAEEALAERGHFALAIPGGSILKMLVGDDILQFEGAEGVAWPSKTTIAYVNHKCVPMDDEQLATHAKAQNLFLTGWVDCNTIVMDGTDDGPAEAASYEAKLKA